eukprot:Hpha_TRINITY_DN24927_c0_g1::TRINITY_DN24927_c0_g1_i1::g.111170::m.111170
MFLGGGGNGDMASRESQVRRRLPPPMVTRGLQPEMQSGIGLRFRGKEARELSFTQRESEEDRTDGYRGSRAVRQTFQPLRGHEKMLQSLRVTDMGVDDS